MHCLYSLGGHIFPFALTPPSRMMLTMSRPPANVTVGITISALCVSSTHPCATFIQYSLLSEFGPLCHGSTFSLWPSLFSKLNADNNVAASNLKSSCAICREHHIEINTMDCAKNSMCTLGHHAMAIRQECGVVRFARDAHFVNTVSMLVSTRLRALLGITVPNICHLWAH